MPLPVSYQEDFERILARSKCCSKGSTVRLQPSCHLQLNGMVFARYRDGVLVLRCAACGRAFKSIAVAAIEEKAT